jgi:hypothetical protein
VTLRRSAFAAAVLALLLGAGVAVAQPDPSDDEEEAAARGPEGQRRKEAERSKDPDAEPSPDEPGDEPSSDGDDPDGDEPDDAPPPKPTKAEPTVAAATTGSEAQVAAGAAAPESVQGDWRESLRWHLGPIRVSPIFLLQTQVVPWVGDDSFFQAGDIAERGGFRLRRGRFGFDGGFTDQARMRFTAELASSEDARIRVRDAWFGYTPYDQLEIYAGAQKMPFSRFQWISSARGVLIERPLATRSLVPGHQVGVTVQGDIEDRALGWAVGAFNGLERDSLFYRGYQENYSPFGNRFDGLSYVARVTSEPFGPLPDSNADEEKGPFRFGVGGNYFFSDGGTRDVHTAGGDVHLMVRGFHLLVEGLWARTIPEELPTRPSDAIDEITSFGMVVEAGYMILPKSLGLAARFEWIDPNNQAEDELDNWLVGAGAQVHLVDRLLKAQLEFTHREERFGLSLDNDVLALQLQLAVDPARPPGDRAAAERAADDDADGNDADDADADNTGDDAR